MKGLKGLWAGTPPKLVCEGSAFPTIFSELQKVGHGVRMIRV